MLNERILPPANAPSVTPQKRGVLWLASAAHELVDDANTAKLLHDRERSVLAGRPSGADVGPARTTCPPHLPDPPDG